MKNKEASLRQKKLAIYMSEHIGMSMEKAMLDLGYSASYANSSDKIKKTKTWRKLMREVLPNSLLVRVTKEGLGATKPIGALVLINNDENGKPKQILKDNEGMIEVADYPTRQRYLETALKMRGKLIEKQDIKSGGKTIVGFNFTTPNEHNTDDKTTT